MGDAVKVTAFLDKFRTVAATHGLTIWATQKNEDFRSETGATNQDILQIIESLRPRNYHSGPEADDDPGRPVGEVWKFSVEWCGYDLYMKLKLSMTPAAECLSCHEREKEMAEPLRLKRPLGAR